MTRLLCFVIVGWLAAVATPAAADQTTEATAATAHQLETRLIAPCCWRETLDIHQSPIADELRREIRQRLTAGESAEQVEAALVSRYGTKLRANLPQSLGYLLFAFFLIGGLTLLAGLGVRLSRKSSATAEAPTNSAPEDRAQVPIADRERQKYEDKLDDDLAAGAL